MDMGKIFHFQWGIMTPEFIIIGATILLVLLDLFMKNTRNRKPLAYIALLAVIASFLSLVMMYGKKIESILNGMFMLDYIAILFKSLLLLGVALVLLLAMSDTKIKSITDRGEYYYLFLTALLGAMFMTSSTDLITLFVGLELLSLSSFILVGIRKKHLGANEAAMKYVINGGISTAITLFGMSYLYGLAGTTNLLEIAQVLSQGMSGDIKLLLSISFLLIFVGLSFKLAIVPFHMWAPDVYEGAPTPVTAFLGTVSKIAGFVIVIRIFFFVFGDMTVQSSHEPMLMSMKGYIIALSILTMIIGNTIALRQTNVKRMFAYSSIAHAGYLLVPFITFSNFTFNSMWFYMLAYVFMNIGVFAVVHALSRTSGREDVGLFSGLYTKDPFTAIMMTIFILSLAGIPGTAGFIGKMNMFLSAFTTNVGGYSLPVVMMITTVISFVYYFRVLQLMFFREQEEETKVSVPWNLRIAMIICAVCTIVLGLFPMIGYNIFYSMIGL